MKTANKTFFDSMAAFFGRGAVPVTDTMDLVSRLYAQSEARQVDPLRVTTGDINTQNPSVLMCVPNLMDQSAFVAQVKGSSVTRNLSASTTTLGTGTVKVLGWLYRYSAQDTEGSDCTITVAQGSRAITHSFGPKERGMAFFPLVGQAPQIYTVAADGALTVTDYDPDLVGFWTPVASAITMIGTNATVQAWPILPTADVWDALMANPFEPLDAVMQVIANTVSREAAPLILAYAA